MVTQRAVVLLVAVAILSSCARITAAETRRWTDKTGKFSVDAELVEAKPDSVVLKKADGKLITVPIAHLSDADSDYLKSLGKPEAKSTPTTVPTRIISFPDAVTEPPVWNDADTPFDLAVFLKAPPPEENAASLYLEAFYEFSPTELIDIVFPNLTAEEKKKRWEASKPIRKERWRIVDAWEKDPKSVKPAEVDAWLANYDKGFELLAAAQERPKCKFQSGRSFHSLVPHAVTPREIGWIVEWRTRRDLERGDLERPRQDIKMLLRLSRDVQVSGGFMSQLHAIALDDRCCQLTCAILNASETKTHHCDQLLALLVEHEASAIDAFVEGNRGEFIHSRQALYDLQHRTGTFDPKFMKEELMIKSDVTSPLICLKYFIELAGYSDTKSANIAERLQGALLPSAWQGGKMLSDEDYAKEVAAVNGFYATILKAAEKPEFRRNGDSEMKAAGAQIEATILARFVIEYEFGLLQPILRDKARLRGTQCLIALKRWQLEHPSQAPPDLATVVKAASMPSVPLDSFSDEPLRMGTVDGKSVIYSVGPDGKDDHAKVEWNLAPGQPGDFIFRFEPASQ